MEKGKTTLLEAIDAAHLRRKYYLNRQVSKFASVASRRKNISIPAGLEYKLTRKQQSYIDELVSNYSYSPQMFIPGAIDTNYK